MPDIVTPVPGGGGSAARPGFGGSTLPVTDGDSSRMLTMIGIGLILGGASVLVLTRRGERARRSVEAAGAVPEPPDDEEPLTLANLPLEPLRREWPVRRALEAHVPWTEATTSAVPGPRGAGSALVEGPERLRRRPSPSPTGRHTAH